MSRRWSSSRRSTRRRTRCSGRRRATLHAPAFEQYAALKASTGGVGITLEELLPGEARVLLRELVGRPE
jgi:hypothetical protein